MAVRTRGVPATDTTRSCSRTCTASSGGQLAQQPVRADQGGPLGTGRAQLARGPHRPVPAAHDQRPPPDQQPVLGQVAGDGGGHDAGRAAAGDAQLGAAQRPRAGRDHQRGGRRAAAGRPARSRAARRRPSGSPSRPAAAARRRRCASSRVSAGLPAVHAAGHRDAVDDRDLGDAAQRLRARQAGDARADDRDRRPVSIVAPTPSVASGSETAIRCGPAARVQRVQERARRPGRARPGSGRRSPACACARPRARWAARAIAVRGGDLGGRHLLARADHLAVARVAGEQLLGAGVPEQPRQRLQLA